MKKVVAAAAAFLAAVAPCSMFFASIEPVRASATEVTLTPIQTRALFGDLLNGEYHPTKVSSLQDCQFEFYSYASIHGQSVDCTFPYTLTGKEVLVYRSPANFDIYTDGYNTFNLRLCPSVSLSGLRYFRMTVGLSTSGTVDPSLPTGASTLSNQKFTLSTDANNSYVTAVNFLTNRYNKSGGGMAEGIVSIDIPNSGVIQDDLLICTNATIDLQNSSKDFTVWMADKQFQGSGFYKNVNIGKPDIITNNSSFNDYYYFFIECPLLSDTYVNNNAPDTSGGGSDSGTDYPDYSGDLQDILDKLDEIAGNQDLYGQVVNEQLNDIYMENQHQNSKLDQVNSNLNKIDSHIQQLQIPDLMSQSSGDMSHIAQNESKNNSDLRAADANQQVINSVAGYGDVSLPNLDNVHSMPDDFSELWNYTDQDGLSWVNPILYAMPILTLTVGALAYIVFGRAR